MNFLPDSRFYQKAVLHLLVWEMSLMSRIERRYCFLNTSYMTGFYFIFDKIMCVLVNFYQRGHFVMPITRSVYLICGQEVTFSSLKCCKTLLKNWSKLILIYLGNICTCTSSRSKQLRGSQVQSFSSVRPSTYKPRDIYISPYNAKLEAK